MTVRFLVIGAVLGIGCGGSNVEGRWDGECEVSNGGQAIVWDVELDIDDDKGGELSGDGELSNGGYSYQGDLEGSRNKTDVNMTWEIESGGNLYEIELDGTVDKEDMTGDCEIRGKGVNYLVQGEFDISRD